MKKLIKNIFILVCMVMLCTPLMAKAEPTEDAGQTGQTEQTTQTEQPLKITSFVLNSKENERFNATLKTSADTEIHFDYKIYVVSDISQQGMEVAYGWGRTGEDTIVDIDMSRINTYDNYRFKIEVTYTVGDQKYIALNFSQIFEYEQETFAEDLSGRDITVDAMAKILKINWSNYDSYRADAVLVLIEVDGAQVVEDVIPIGEQGYDYYFDQNTKQIKVTLKQVFDGKLSQGITDTIDIVKAADTKDFYINMPELDKQYDAIWNISYYNGEATKLYWKSDSDRGEYEFTGNGSFLVEMREDNEKLFISYTDAKNVIWEYDMLTTIVEYAPNIQLLEKYNGTSVEDSSITIVGKVDDTSAIIKVNGVESPVDKNGTFSQVVDLSVGKNVIDIEATSIIGKSSRTSITVYKAGEDNAIDENSFLSKYSTLIVSLGASVVLLIVLIVIAKKGGKKHEKEA